MSAVIWKEPKASFLITWRTGSWPISIDITETAFEKYCIDQVEVDAWKKEYAQWASLEGNKVEYNIWTPGGEEGLKLIESRWF